MSAIRIVSTLAVLKPGSTRPSAMAERMSSVEPTSSVSARATSVTTRAARVRPCKAPPLPDRPPSFSASVTFGRELWSAGNRPNSRPVASATTIVNASTRQSTPTSAPSAPTRGRLAVLIDEQRPDAERAQRQPQRPAGERQDQALGEQLPDDLAPRGAERGAHGQFAAPAGGAHEQQVGDVGAGDEQHEADRAREHEQRRADVADQHPAHRLDAEAGVGTQGAAAEPGAEVGRRRLQPGPCLFDRHAGEEPPGGLEVVRVIAGRGVELERQEELRRLLQDVFEPRLAEHADHRVGLAVERDGPADDAGISRVPRRPQPMAQHRDAAATGPVLVGGERPASRRRDPEEREEVGRDAGRSQLLGETAFGQVDERGGEGRRRAG